MNPGCSWVVAKKSRGLVRYFLLTLAVCVCDVAAYGQDEHSPQNPPGVAANGSGTLYFLSAIYGLAISQQEASRLQAVVGADTVTHLERIQAALRGRGLNSSLSEMSLSQISSCQNPVVIAIARSSTSTLASDKSIVYIPRKDLPSLIFDPNQPERFHSIAQYLSDGPVYQALSISQGVRDSGAPPVKVSPEVFDFGHVASGAEVVALFRVENKGPFPLLIESLKSNCGCTSTAVWDKAIPPLEHTVVELKLNTENNAGKTNYQAWLTLQGYPGVIRFDATGVVHNKCLASPDTLDLGRVTKDEVRTASVNLALDGYFGLVFSPDFRDVAARSANSFLPVEIELKTVDEQGRLAAAELKFRLAVNTRPGQISDVVAITLRDEVVARIPVKAIVLPIMTANVRRITLDSDLRLGAGSPEVWIAFTDHKRRSVTASSERGRVETVLEAYGDDKYRVLLSARPAPGDAILEDNLSISCPELSETLHIRVLAQLN